MRNRIILIATALLILFPVLVQAQILIAPETTLADGDGNFQYAVAMTYPPSGALFGGYTIYDTENIGSGTMWIDGFCMSFVEGGTETYYVVEGSLADPNLDGIVTFEWFGCDPGFSVTAPTIIRAPGVPVDTPSWSALKAMYR